MMTRLFSLPIQKTHIITPLIILLIALVLFLFDGQVHNQLNFDRLTLPNEWWRVLTGHFLHTNLTHFLLNSGGLLLLWALHGEYYRAANLMGLFLLLCIGCSAGIYFFAPELNRYVGLSGALHGLFFYGAIMDIRTKRTGGILLVIGGAVKVAYENIFGASQSVVNAIGANVAVESHLWGGIAGILITLLCWKLYTPWVLQIVEKQQSSQNDSTER